MKVKISKKGFNEYLSKKESISNQRLRPDGENFFDALMSIDMKNDPEGKRVIEIIKAL